MTLIAILLALATERYWHPFSSYKLFSPLLSWRDLLALRCQRVSWFDGANGVLLTVAPAILLVALLQYGLAGTSGFVMWMIKLIFSFMVLVACIGEQRFGVHVRKYLELVSAGDTDAACAYVNRLSGKDISADNLRQINRNFLGLLLWRLNERVLALLFWFVILGPVGAILYRSVAQLQGTALTVEPMQGTHDDAGFQGDGYRDAVRRLKGILDWLPVRLTALYYAMIGSFSDAMQLWRSDPGRADDDWVMSSERLLPDVGIGALQIQHDYTEDNEEGLDAEVACRHVLAVRSLSKRAVLAWITILALLTLVGWLS